MRKVMTVVPVLITSCQVSLKLKIGPVTAQIATTAAARRKMAGLPQKSEAWRAKRPNQSAGWDTPFFAGFVLCFFMYKQVIGLQCVPLLRKFLIKSAPMDARRQPSLLQADHRGTIVGTLSRFTVGVRCTPGSEKHVQSCERPFKACPAKPGSKG